jgi:hypothetical protein
LCCSLFDRHHSPFDLVDAQMAFWAQGTTPRRTQAAARRLPPHLALPPPPLPSPTQTPEDPRRLRLIATTGSSEGSLAPAPATTGSRRAPRLTPPPLRPPIPNQARVRIVAHLGLAATRRLNSRFTNASFQTGQQPLQFGLAHFPPLSSQSQQPKHTGYTKGELRPQSHFPGHLSHLSFCTQILPSSRSSS